MPNPNPTSDRSTTNNTTQQQQQEQKQESKSEEDNAVQEINPGSVIQVSDNPLIILMSYMRHEDNIILFDITQYYGTPITNDELLQKLPDCEQWIIKIVNGNRMGDLIRPGRKIVKLRFVNGMVQWRLCSDDES